MKIAVIGAGYVGLVSAACFAEFGVQVTCVDSDADRVANLKRGAMPIFEPGLNELVARVSADGNLRFSTNLALAMQGADAVFIAVGTPTMAEDGRADLSQVFQAAKDIAKNLSGYTVIVTKSTVPVGTGREISRIVRETRPDADFDVCSNPEFLREGSAIGDFLRPDRVVIGSSSERATAVLKSLYRPLYLIETPMVITSLETAELIKYASNAFLATKITFINEMADLCEKVGADVQTVAKGMGLDGRIGRKFLHSGPGYGGSCFPKDTAALAATARDNGATLGVVSSVIAANSARKKGMARRIIAACGGSVAGSVVAVLGLTFKPNTDDMRESASLEIVPALLEAGAFVRAYDPAGMAEAKKLLPSGIEWCEGPYDAMSDADAVVIITEWNEFRAMDAKRIISAMRSPLMIDLRNIYNPEDMAAAGITYVSVGRPKTEPPPAVADARIVRLRRNK